jgi:hypothetical protein
MKPTIYQASIESLKVTITLHLYEQNLNLVIIFIWRSLWAKFYWNPSKFQRQNIWGKKHSHHAFILVTYALNEWNSHDKRGSQNYEYSKSCNIWHLRDQRVARYHNFVNIRTFHLMYLLVYLATSRPNAIT